MPKVFISYVRENSEDVQRLARELGAYGIKVWLDKNDIKPGFRWKDAIREAISQGDFFIACFSSEYSERSKTYMNEELTLAVEELRQRPTDRAWFIPVLLSDTDIPTRSIGAGETLDAIQRVDLYQSWNDGIKRILSVIQPDFVDEPPIHMPRLSDDDWRILLYRIKQGKCTPFIGPAASYGVLPHDSSVAREWAMEYNYPEAGPIDLAKVAQFLTMIDNMLPRELIKKKFTSVSPPDFTAPGELHKVLSALPLPLYITTNYDDFMLRALQAQNKEAKSEFHRWNEQLRNIPSSFDDIDFEPTIERPIVFHLYGHIEFPESMIITEDDYREFLLNTSKKGQSLPLCIEKALTGTLPFFLGYNPSDEKFRNLMQILVPYLKLNIFRPVGSFQPGEFKVPKYLEHQFEGTISGSRQEAFREFTAELRRRWEACQHG